MKKTIVGAIIAILLLNFSVFALEVEPFCTDTDEGNFPNTGGHSFDSFFDVFFDICSDPTHLKEASCDGVKAILQDPVDCNNGCIDVIDGPDHCAYCGDGVVSDTEECDDGNAAIGDGCTPNCTLEQTNDVPEFGFLGAGIALAGAATYTLFRRRK